MRRLLSLAVIGLGFMAADASAQCVNGRCYTAAPASSGGSYVIMRRPCYGVFGIRQRKWDRMYSPRAVKVPVQPMRWVPGRWVPVEKQTDGE